MTASNRPAALHSGRAQNGPRAWPAFSTIPNPNPNPNPNLNLNRALNPLPNHNHTLNLNPLPISAYHPGTARYAAIPSPT